MIFEHPADRIGDLTVGSDARTALGKAQAKHDLTNVESGLRWHGGRHEQIVPIVVSHQMSSRYAAWHAAGAQSRDLFDFVLNGVVLARRPAGRQDEYLPERRAAGRAAMIWLRVAARCPGARDRAAHGVPCVHAAAGAGARAERAGVASALAGGVSRG